MKWGFVNPYSRLPGGTRGGVRCGTGRLGTPTALGSARATGRGNHDHRDRDQGLGAPVAAPPGTGPDRTAGGTRPRHRRGRAQPPRSARRGGQGALPGAGTARAALGGTSMRRSIAIAGPRASAPPDRGTDRDVGGDCQPDGRAVHVPGAPCGAIRQRLRTRSICVRFRHLLIRKRKKRSIYGSGSGRSGLGMAGLMLLEMCLGSVREPVKDQG